MTRVHGLTPEEARLDPQFRGRLVESAVGGDGIPLEEFLSSPVEAWLRP